MTHESLTTFMAEVSAIINARPLTSISSDPDDPTVLTPATLLTQKTEQICAPLGEFNSRDLYRQVQSLSNSFWDKWKKQYIPTLQPRRKWQTSKPNLQPGDVVLMKDCQSRRNEWPLGLVTKTFPSKDGITRKVELKTRRQGENKLFLRPVGELVLLFTPNEYNNDVG